MISSTALVTCVQRAVSCSSVQHRVVQQRAACIVVQRALSCSVQCRAACSVVQHVAYSIYTLHTSILVSFMILSLALACLSLHSLGSESQHLGEEQEHGRSTCTAPLQCWYCGKNSL